MTDCFADRFLAAAAEKGAPVCVGLDPVFERLPAAVRGNAAANHAEQAAEIIGQWCGGVLQAVAPHVPCVKLQSACFERYLWHGVRIYHELVATARRLGLIVIGDAKRGDIGASSAHYAAGNLADTTFADLGPLAGPDALTVNGYLGADALQPFIETATAQGKGLFVLVRTSNPGGDGLQTLQLTDGRRVCDAVADMVGELGAADVGESGYSSIGAVVGATRPDEIADLRQRMPRQVFLLPGYGAQGGSAADVKPAFDPDRRGALVTASRSVIYAYQSDDADQPRTWTGAVEAAAIRFRDEIAEALG